jgi:hypothetical protein
VRHVARVSCKCCVHLPREQRATRDVTFGPLCTLKDGKSPYYRSYCKNKIDFYYWQYSCKFALKCETKPFSNIWNKCVLLNIQIKIVNWIMNPSRKSLKSVMSPCDKPAVTCRPMLRCHWLSPLDRILFLLLVLISARKWYEIWLALFNFSTRTYTKISSVQWTNSPEISLITVSMRTTGGQ